jgi:hypothetical protein
MFLFAKNKTVFTPRKGKCQKRAEACSLGPRVRQAYRTRRGAGTRVCAMVVRPQERGTADHGQKSAPVSFRPPRIYQPGTEPVSLQ